MKMPNRLRRLFFNKPCRLDDAERLAPLSRRFGFDRGTPVDRRYIERFLDENRARVHGIALEIADNAYSSRFGGSAVTRYEVLHKDNKWPARTLAGDLEVADSLPENYVDVFIRTQVLPFLFDVPMAIGNIHRVLKPGGAVLCTLPGISQISRYDAERWGDYWRFTPQGARRLFEARFAEATITTYGNCLAAKAFLDGLAVEDFADPALLDAHDADYPVIIAVMARK